MHNPQIAPAPWSLKGNGIVVLYQFPSGFIQEYGFMEDFQRRNFKAGLGAVMLMDYTNSNAGPYRELLFLPGIIKPGGNSGFSVSKIYVSTQSSVNSGRRNWGLPKELADFEVTEEGDRNIMWKVAKGGKTFFEAVVKPFGIKFPFSSLLIPFSRLMQEGPDGLLLTRPRAKGKIQAGGLKMVRSDAAFFPPVGELKPMAVFSLPEFRMKFPVALSLKNI